LLPCALFVPTRPLHGSVERHGSPLRHRVVWGAFDQIQSAQAGDNAALLLCGVKRGQVRRGQVLCAPGSVQPHERFRARVHLLTAAKRGRHTGFGGNYRPQFHFRTTDVAGSVDLDGGIALPGDTLELTVGLGVPVALHAGLGFAIREGGRTVGAGTVLAVLD